MIGDANGQYSTRPAPAPIPQPDRRDIVQTAMTPTPSTPLPELPRLLLARERARGFSSLAGARLCATLPIPGEWINEILRYKPPPGLREIAVALLDGNRGVLLITPEMPLARRWEIPFRIAPEAAVPPTPLLTIHLEPAGLAAAALPVVAARLNREDGIFLNGRTLQCNLATLLRRGGAQDLLALLEGLRLRTAPGRLILEVKLTVPDTAITPETKETTR